MIHTIPGMPIIHTNYETELAEAEELLAIDSELTLVGCETTKQKWFELGVIRHRMKGFLKIPYLHTTFNSTIEITNPKGPPKC